MLDLDTFRKVLILYYLGGDYPFFLGLTFWKFKKFVILLLLWVLPWRRWSLFFLDQRSWKINEVFKVFQIPLDLKLAAGTQTRKENLLQIVFKTCLRAFFALENNFKLNFAPLFTFMPSHNVYMDKKKPRHSRNNFGRLAWLSSFNNKIT